MKLASKVDNIIAKEALRWAVLKLQQERIGTASLDGRILLEHVLGVNREQLLFLLDLPITPAQYTRLKILVDKRAQRQPIAQLIGKREFWGMNFVVSNDTLDPRPDSETLIEYVLERISNRADVLRVLDLGTGTGCLLLAMLSELPAAKGVGVDYCDKALLVAKENAMALGFAGGRTQFIRSDWCGQLEGEFDIILANPPYIPTAIIPTLDPEVSEFEPMLALDGGDDGFNCYRKIMKDLPKIMAKNGFVAFELGMGQQRGLEEIALANNLKTVGVRQDLSGVARCIILQHKE
ncbi:MAG: peptide chain release factor N(5)-glutamine methyltransferase [Rickettsiales bacterium]|jgi:release factor glutamine methyltransferase